MKTIIKKKFKKKRVDNIENDTEFTILSKHDDELYEFLITIANTRKAHNDNIILNKTVGLIGFLLKPVHLSSIPNTYTRDIIERSKYYIM